MLKIRRESDAIQAKLKTDMMAAKNARLIGGLSVQVSESMGTLAGLAEYLLNDATVEVRCLEPAESVLSHISARSHRLSK